jgi:hypothetical protein
MNIHNNLRTTFPFSILHPPLSPKLTSPTKEGQFP